MPRTRVATRKSVGATRGQSSSRQSTGNQEISEVRQKRTDDRGKGPADDSEDEVNSSQSGSEVAVASDEEMGDAEEQEIDLRTISADDYAIMRHRNQFELSRSSLDLRFHIRFQE